MDAGLLGRYAGALVVLPGTVLGLVPFALSRLTADTAWQSNPISLNNPLFLLAVVIGMMGFLLASWTNRLFLLVGKGTPAPWSPPKKFVVHGPYRYVRNPMMLAVYLMLAAEALFFGSPAIWIWLAVFVIGNLIYIPLSEEKGLRKRFGEDYVLFCRNVPRWIPRLRPWRQP